MPRIIGDVGGARGRVSIRLWPNERATLPDGVSIYGVSIDDATAADGTYAYVLHVTDTLIPADQTYRVIETSPTDGTLTTRYITVPTGTADGTTVASLAVSDPGDVDHNVPAGGTTGQVLNKASDADYATAWTTLTDVDHGVPGGGTTGQVLAKSSNTDFDAGWVDDTDPAFATPSIALGTAAAAGAAGTVIRSDSTIAAFDATAPVTQAFGDVASVGAAAVAARRDHTHGMPAGIAWESVPVPTDAPSWDIGTAAHVTGDAPPTSPLTVVAGVNDTFVYTPNSTVVPETFTVAPGTYTGLAAITAAMAAAVGGSAERFDTLCTVGDDGTHIVLTEIIHNIDGSTITLGLTDVAAALGFTANPDTFAGQTGSVGAWDFSTPGVIAQTDPNQTNASLNTVASELGTAWAVECDLRVDATNGGGAGGMFAAGVFPGIASSAVAAVGLLVDPSPFFPDAIAYVDTGGIAIRGPLVGEWHTYKVIVSNAMAQAYLDGVLFEQGIPPTQNFWGSPPASPFGFLNVGGAVTFRNLKAWRIPVPTLV